MNYTVLVWVKSYNPKNKHTTPPETCLSYEDIPIETVHKLFHGYKKNSNLVSFSIYEYNEKENGTYSNGVPSDRAKKGKHLKTYQANEHRKDSTSNHPAAG